MNCLFICMLSCQAAKNCRDLLKSYSLVSCYILYIYLFYAQVASPRVPGGPIPKKKRVLDGKGGMSTGLLLYNIGVVGAGNMARAIVEGSLLTGETAVVYLYTSM